MARGILCYSQEGEVPPSSPGLRMGSTMTPSLWIFGPPPHHLDFPGRDLDPIILDFCAPTGVRLRRKKSDFWDFFHLDPIILDFCAPTGVRLRRKKSDFFGFSTWTPSFWIFVPPRGYVFGAKNLIFYVFSCICTENPNG